MAERNKSTKALILSVKEMGESNRTVQVLSESLGMFRATLYGGPKSKLRSLVQPFNTGTLWLYEDESRQSRKITDFDVSDCHNSLHESLPKIWAANLAAELLLRTHCAGDDHNAYILLKALVDGMDRSSEDEARTGLLRFLWRYLGLLGVQPDTESCAGCGTRLAGIQGMQQIAASCIPAENGFVCPDCRGSRQGEGEAQVFRYELSGEGLFYLTALNTLQPGVVRAIRLSAQTIWQLKQLLFTLAEQAAGCKLKTLESGMGIL